jgi:formylglycine-generating enzyme required for sulfatase activity
MRHLHLSLMAVIVLLVVAAACAPQSGPGQPQALSSTQQPATAQPTEPVSVVPPEPALTESLAPITLSIPPMQVGSLYRYFDGALLDAIPNDGPFLMGGVAEDNRQHQVTVSDYWMYSTEVTNQMYAWCVSLGKCTPPGAAANPGYADPKYLNYPVVGMDWQQASDYCGFAHGRLPTEAEWEKAASWDASLKQKRIYPWGDHRPTCDLLNYKNCLFRSAPVTNYGQGRSFYGVLNLEGNVFEWVNDWYSPTYYATSPANDPQGPDSGGMRVMRSSAFGSDGYIVDPARRSYAKPWAQRSDLGFRCVVQDPSYFAPYCSVSVYYPAITAGGAGPQKPCADPVIEQTSYCAQNKTPVVNVTVHNSPPTLVSISGLEQCSPANNDANAPHQCGLGVKIQVQATCPSGPAGSATCPANYSRDPNDPNRCVSVGAVGACPTGFQYDDSLKCCSAVPGNAAAVPLCAVGQHIYNSVCVDDVTGPQGPASPTLVTSTGLTCVSSSGH